MSKPVLSVTLTTHEEKMISVHAVFDTGSFYSIIRQDLLPKGTTIIRYKTPKELGTAQQGGRIRITGLTDLVINIGKRMIRDGVYVSPDLKRDLLVGAGTMQLWDISVRNRNGKTQVVVGRDMRDPDITEVD